ncbi:MAG: efflux RND transporter permease subunit, partial [Leptospiraceae bacterium]|nr:efflux RND transporter permease subunit [Leptospiraceae bacterium]
RKLARDLEDLFLESSGVGGVSKVGYRKREVQIDVSIDRMKENRISFAEMMSAVQARNVRLTGGTIESFVSEKKIVTLAEYEKLQDVGEVIIRSNFGGNNLRIKDVARVQSGFAEANVLYRTRGQPSIALVVTQQPNADVIDLSDDLRSSLEQFQQGLPGGVKADIVFDFAVYTRIMLDMVIQNGLFGFALVLFVLYVFLDVRSAFWAAFGIPFSIFGALIVFSISGISLNQITLVTMILVLGIVVDDAIVIAEKIHSLKQSGMEAHEAVRKGVREMMLPVTAAIITTILAFAPIMFIGGIFGKFLGAIPVVLSLVLIFSWIESILFLPSHVQHIDIPPEIPRRIRWLEKVKEFYEYS